jgi:hypothetical protein
MLKHVTPSQFMWVTYDKDGKVTRAAGGSYTLKGDEYAETPEYGIGSDFAVIKGGTHTFQVKGRRQHVAAKRQAQQRPDHRRGMGAGREGIAPSRVRLPPRPTPGC